MERLVFRVLPLGSRWKVHIDGARRPASHHERLDEAVAFARLLASNRHDIVIHHAACATSGRECPVATDHLTLVP